MATHRQIEANRKNSALSTGPTSDEGKARSRANATTHGLSGAGVALLEEDADRVAERLVSWRPGYDLNGPEDEWTFRELVTESVRVDRCRVEERTLRGYEAERATLLWDDDRRLLVERLATRLHTDPALVARQLRATRHGCEWLLDQWQVLGEIDTWTEAHWSRVLDLLGVVPAFRGYTPEVAPAELVADEVSALEDLLASHARVDAMERSAAESGRPLDLSPTLKRLRRYESGCLRRLDAARKTLRNARREFPCLPQLPEPAPAPVSILPPPVEPEKAVACMAPAPAPVVVAAPPSFRPLASLAQGVNRAARRAARSQNRR